jgi:hypothetical protein
MGIGLSATASAEGSRSPIASPRTHHPCRRVDRERLGEDLVDDREIGHVGKEHRRVDDELRAAAARAKHQLEVAHRLPRLVAKRGTRGLARLGVDARLPGDIEEIAGTHALRIRADCHAGTSDHFAFDRHGSPDRSAVRFRSLRMERPPSRRLLRART